MSLWDYLYGGEQTRDSGGTSSLWEYINRDLEEEQRKRREEYQKQIAEMASQRARSPDLSRATTDRNTIPTGTAVAAGPGQFVGPEEPAFTTPQMERVTQPPISGNAQQGAPEQPNWLTAREGPVEELGQDLQRSWQQQMQALQQFQQQAQQQQMMQQPISVEGDPNQYFGEQVGPALDNWMDRQQQEQMMAPPIPVNVQQGPDPSRMMQPPISVTARQVGPEDAPPTTPEGRISHEAQEPRGPGLLTRLATAIADAGSAGWDKYRDFSENVDEAAYGSDKMIGTISRFLRGADREASVEALRMAESVAEIPTRMIEVGKAVVDADYKVLDAITKSGNTNDVSEWVSNLGDALKAQAPEDMTTEEKIGGIVGMFGVMAAEYGIGGGLIRSGLGLNKAAKGLEVTREFGKIAQWLGKHPGAARRAQWLANTAALGAKRVAGNVAAYGPIDLTQVWTGDASLPYLIEMVGEDKAPDWMKAMNKSDIGRATFELVIGASADLLFESVSAGRVVARERSAFEKATPQAAAYARANQVPLRDVPLTEGRGKLVTEPAQTDLFGVASGPEVTRRLPGEERIRLPEVKKRQEQILSDQRKLGRSVEEAAVRGKAALDRAWKRFNVLSASKPSTLHSFGPDWEVFFDPEIVRDMGLWGGSVLARARGKIARAEFDNVLKDRFPGITARVLDEGWAAARNEYEAYLNDIASKRSKLFSRLEPGEIVTDRDIATRPGYEYTQPEQISGPETFGDLADRLLKVGVGFNGHEWYSKELVPWVSHQIGADEGDAKLYIALYTALSGGTEAGSTNILFSNKAFARYKAGELWVPEAYTKQGQPIWTPNQAIGPRGRTVAPILADLVEARNLLNDPIFGIKSPKFGNFYGSLTGRERTTVDMWIQRVYGYEYWKPGAKVTWDSRKERWVTSNTSETLYGRWGADGKYTNREYEFIAADIDHMKHRTKPGGDLHAVAEAAGRPEGMRQEEIQAAIWVGAKAEAGQLGGKDSLPVIELLAGKIDDLRAHATSDDFAQAKLREFGTVNPSKGQVRDAAKRGSEVALRVQSEAGSAHIAALAYLSNATAAGLLGLTQGDTWEERVGNAIKLGIGGALGTRVAHGWIRALKDRKGLKEAITMMFSDPTVPDPEHTLSAFTRTPFARGAAVGAVGGGAAGYEEGGLKGAAYGALAGAGLGGGGAQLLAHTKIGRRLGWDSRGAIGDLSSFRELPHETRTQFMEKLVSDGTVRQDWLGEIELKALDGEVDELIALRDLGAEALRDMPRVGKQVGTAARKRIEDGIYTANKYIDELKDSPLTSETLRTLDQGRVGDISPAYKHPDFEDPFEGGSHFIARTKAGKETGQTLIGLDKVGTDGFVVKVEGQKPIFLTRNQATQLVRERGVFSRSRRLGEAGMATPELLRALRDVLGGAAVGGAVGGSFDTENRGLSAGIGAAVGAGLGMGSVRGRRLREEAVGYAGRSQGNRVRLGKLLQEQVDQGSLNIRQFDDQAKLRQYLAGQGADALPNATRTAAYVPAKQEIIVLTDKAARELGYNQRDLISHMISEPDIQGALKANSKAAQEALQKIRAALTGPGGYTEQAAASGLPESALRYIDRLERQAEKLGIPERQIEREALGAMLAAERVAAGKNPATALKGSIKPRKSFTDFLGEITKFNIATQSAEKRLAEVWDAHRKAAGLKKTVQHDAAVRGEVEKIVREMGLDPKSKALELVPGTTKEQMLAIRDIVGRNAEDLDKIAKFLNDNVLTADETRVLGAHADALTKQIGDMLDRFSKTRTEYGRNLRSLSLVAQRIFDPDNRSTWYLLAQERSPTGLLTEEMRTTIDAFLAEGNKEGLIDFIATMKPASRVRQGLRFWKAMLLTSPKTHLRNILGNTAMATMEELKEIPAFGADFLVTNLARKAGYTAQYTKATKNLRMVSKAGRDGAVEGIRDAYKAMKGMDPDMTLKQVKQKLDIVGDVHMDNRLLESAVTFAFRTLSAEDKFFRSVASSRSLLEQAATIARNEGLAGKKSKEWMRARTRKLLEKPTDEMMLRAVEDAEWAVFQNSNYWARQINRLKRGPGGPVVEYLMPFVNTPMNIFSRIIDYSPAGGVIAAKKAVELMRKAKITNALDPKIQKEFVDRAGRATVGSIAMLTGYLFYKSDKMRVSYPDKPSEREKWKLTGEQDGSILVGGKWRNIRNVSPVGNLMLIGGAIAQLEDDPEIGTNLVTLAEGAGGAAIEQFREMPMLTGINTFSRAIDNWDYESGRMVRNMARSLVPAIIRDLSHAMDSTVRATKYGGPVESAQSAVPVASRYLPPQIDVLGRELKRDQGVPGSFFDLFSSRTDKRDTKDPVVRALLDLDVNISARSRYDNETDWQYHRRAKAQGEDLYKRIQAEIATPQFRSLSQEDQADHLRKRISVWRRRMTEAWDDAHPDYP